MKNQIKLSSLSKETQAMVKKEWVARKVVAAKPLSDADFKVIGSLRYKKEELEEEAQEELEEALCGLLDNTTSFYKFNEDAEITRRTDSKIKSYIKTKLFSEVTLPRALKKFLKDPESAMESALDGNVLRFDQGMNDDQDWDDFIFDMKAAAKKRLQELETKK